MGFFLNFGFGNNQSIKEPLKVENDSFGNIFYTMFSSMAGLGKKIPDNMKLNAVCNNPALLKVIALDCDIFSLGKVNKYQEDKIKEVDFLYSLTKQPNLLSSWTQFFWNYKFYLDIFGEAYLYNPNNSKVLSDNNSLQWLDPSKIDWSSVTIRKLQSFIFSKATFNEVFKNTITYRFDNGEYKIIKLSEIHTFYDLTNIGQENPLEGISRVDALYKVINNSELALDAKGINLFLSGKVMVAGQNNIENEYSMPMSEAEKESIESKVMSQQTIHAVKSLIDVKRFVEDIKKLSLDESFYNDYFMFGSMFNIPRDILETNLKSATYENQEKSMARFIEYSQAPKGKKLTDWFEIQYDLQDIRMSWNHLAFMLVFAKDTAENNKIISEALLNFIKAGIPLMEINQLLGTKFTKADYKTNI